MTRKQERARARRRWEKQQARQAQREADRARLLRVASVVGVVVLVVGLLVVLGLTVGRSTGRSDAAGTGKDNPSTEVVAGCQPPPSPLGTGAELTLPDKKTAAGKTFTATITTNCGDLVVRLDGTKAPQAVASFLQLAREQYWKDSPCHRLTTGATFKVLQCGDPTGTGQGEPGYGFGVENAPKDGTYTRGTLAMARTTDPTKGNGGQFFIVYGDTKIPDPSGYTVFGTVTSGLDIVDRVAAEGVAPNDTSPDDGAPAAPISILRVAVTEEKS